MNISYKWLKEYVDFNLSPDELAAALTSIGLETGSVEEVESIRGGLRGIVIGKVLTCTEHPDSDHLHVTTVDLGDGQATQIVCGAPNVAAGQTVVVATVGTTLYDGDKEFKIKKSKIRGVESFGMICAEDEIGIGTSHDGIIVLNDEIAPGTPAAEYYGISSDYVLEVDLTPNRIDAASHYGVARDLSAKLAAQGISAPLIRPEAEGLEVNKSSEPAIDVEVANPEACTRYAGVTIRNIKVAESPKWLKDKLTTIGLRPINNIVDITNYILHAFCQPLHCFDLDKIKGGKIIVKTCADGTPFTTLDGVEHKLDSHDLMICNTEEPMCIAGVFGGLDSGVTEDTTSVFIESACFNPTSVRKTARRHTLNTDSSFRFERGVDPNGTMYALKIAAKLIQQLAGGEIAGDFIDIYPEPVAPAEVKLEYKYLRDLVGKDIPQETVDSILGALEIEIKSREEGAVNLAVPTYRVDVTRPCDVVEDVLRIYGYNNVEMPQALHASLSFKTATDSADNLQKLISEQLTAQGFNEILNNSLTAEAYYSDLKTYPADHCVHLLNPLSNDLNVMRQTLIFGGLESIAHNINRRLPDLLMYEFGNVYFCNPEAQSTPEAPLAPFSEQSRLAIWLTGNIRQQSWNSVAAPVTIYDLKAIVANIFTRLGVNAKEIVLKQSADNELFAAAISIDTRSGKHIGCMGMVAKAQLKKLDIKQEVVYAELDWKALVAMALRSKVTYAPLPKTQPVVRDLALLIDKSVTMERIEAVVRESERKLLRTVKLFDVYEGKNLPEGKKSYAISITLQDDEKTMQDKQIDAIMNKIITNLKKQLGAELR
ncbi:MAG: phenylalanine--tRNA ligase subunit beta [Muribaculaceae bacterium]